MISEGNGGGSRKALQALLPYFIKETQIVNVARYRINAKDDHIPNKGYLERRFCYPQYISEENYKIESNDSDFRDFQEAISKFTSSFNPHYIANEELFSDYHYMAIHPHLEGRGYYYEKPVIVLIDEGCFSASDIFAAGMRTGDRVVLLGNTTGGGSGYSKRIRLPNSEISVKLSRMISFQPQRQALRHPRC